MPLLGCFALAYCVRAAYCYRRSSVVCLSVGRRSVTTASCAKTAEQVEIPFGMWTRPRNRILNGVPNTHT